MKYLTACGIVIIILWFGCLVLTSTSYAVAVQGPDARGIMEYVHGSPDVPRLTERELLHLQDVTTLIQRTRLVLTILAALAGLMVSYAVFSGSIRPAMTVAAGISAGSALVIMFAAIFFEASFLAFHKIAFVNDLWLLPRGSFLLETFPPSFFRATLVTVILYMLICSLLLAPWKSFLRRMIRGRK